MYNVYISCISNDVGNGFKTAALFVAFLNNANHIPNISHSCN
jgi:hypothetical protein